MPSHQNLLFLICTKHSLTLIFVVVSLISGNGHPGPTATVYCNDDHTVDVNIINVNDIADWMPPEWRLENNTACDPTLDVPGQMVNYQDLKLPDCAFKAHQYPDHIKYILKIEAKKDDPGAGTQQLRAYDHHYYVSCDYDNQNRSTASFIPIVNRKDNDTGMEYEIAISFAPFKGKQLLHF